MSINLNKNIYIIRHCEAEGQSEDAPLTVKGLEQAEKLSDFFYNKKVDHIISSPFLRAIQTIQPLANRLNLEIQIDNRLSECLLSSMPMSDWLDKLHATFDNLDLKYSGGESSKEAMDRIVNVVIDSLESGHESTVIVTHGNIMSLLLHHFDKNFGFEQWKELTNPDVYLLNSFDEKINYTRLWDE